MKNLFSLLLICFQDFAFEAKTLFDKCDGTCTRELNEICGSDGLTYATPCLLDYQACRNKVEGNKPVTLLHEGKCAEGKGSKRAEGAEDKGSKVEQSRVGEGLKGEGAGDDGFKSDGSSDDGSEDKGPKGRELQGSRGEGSTERGVDDTKLKGGETKGKESKARVLEGLESNSDGPSEEKKFRSRRATRMKDQEVKKQGEGQKVEEDCATKICHKNMARVCGSDGKTYSNKCVMDRESCKIEKEGKAKVKVKHQGKCK